MLKSILQKDKTIVNNQKKTISIIVPFFNEQETIKEVILSLISQNFINKIILVNDGSTDNSLNIAKALKNEFKNIQLISNDKNYGKGYAIQSGIKLVNTELIGIFDADLEYSSVDLKNIYEYIQSKDYDFVCGSRFLGEMSRKNIYLRTYLANQFLSRLFSITYKNKITDVATCLKVFKTNLINEVILTENGFAIEIELLAKCIKKSSKYFEVPITYNGRTYKEGKKIKFIDGIRYIFAIFKYR